MKATRRGQLSCCIMVLLATIISLTNMAIATRPAVAQQPMATNPYAGYPPGGYSTANPYAPAGTGYVPAHAPQTSQLYRPPMPLPHAGGPGVAPPLVTPGVPASSIQTNPLRQAYIPQRPSGSAPAAERSGYTPPGPLLGYSPQPTRLPQPMPPSGASGHVPSMPMPQVVPPALQQPTRPALQQPTRPALQPPTRPAIATQQPIPQPVVTPRMAQQPQPIAPSIIATPSGLRFPPPRMPIVQPIGDGLASDGAEAMPIPETKPEEIMVPDAVVGKIEDGVVVEETVLEPAVCWEGSFELGLNGSSGNSEIFNFRFGVDGKRKSDFTELTLDLDYKQDSKDSIQTANRLFFDGRNEWLLGASPWSIFLHGTAEYDEFQSFDTRLASDAGFGYQFFKTDITDMKGRIGAGLSHEIGGPTSDTPIEASFGLDYSRKISAKQKFSASVNYFPEFADFMNCRVISKADWELLIDELSNLSLKIGVVDRYDSTPNGAKHNDLDYAVTILWKF